MQRPDRIRGTHVTIVIGSTVLLGVLALVVATLAFTLGREYGTSKQISSSTELLRSFGKKESVTIVFLGDMMFDRYIRRMARTHGEDHILSCAASVTKNADLVVGNLEGPITDEVSVSEGSIVGSANNYRFTFPPSTASLLKRSDIGIVNLGNNHIGDVGAEGMQSTRTYLNAAGVAHFGGLAGDEPVYRTEVRDLPLSFVSYNQFGGAAPETIARTIASEHSSGRIVIVYTHWGDEYVEPTVRMREIAHLFADSGAALVIGSHPHVVQEHEVIGNTVVYYSLGNFIFDQYWDESVSTGLVVRTTIESDGSIAAEETQVRMLRDGRTCISG